MDFLREKISVCLLAFCVGVLLFSMPGCGDGKKTKVKNPKNVKVYFDAAKEYDKAGKHDKAIEFYTKTIKEDSNHAKAYRNRGMVHDRVGNTEKATKDFVKAHELDKTDMYPAQQLARIYRQQGDMRNAQKYEDEMEKRQQKSLSNTRNNKDQIDKQKKAKK